MKTKQLINLALISGLLLTAGCGDDQNTGTAENNDPVELRISPRVTLTRGVVDGTAFADGTTVAVYAEGADYTSDKSNNYAKYKYSSSAWNSDGSDKIYLTNAEATIYAYYPTDDKHNITNLTIPVKLLEGTDATITAVNNVTGTSIAAATGEVDCMYARPFPKVTNKSNQTKGVELTMNHALSMVSFRVYKAADYEGTGKLTKIVLKNVDAGTTLSKGTNPTMNIKTGVITEGTPTAATYTRTIKDGYTLESTTNGTGAKKFSIMVLPISTSIGNDKIQATFTIDGAEYTVKLTAPSDNSGTWPAGKNHLYTVKLSGTELFINTITVTQWEEVVGSANLDIK